MRKAYWSSIAIGAVILIVGFNNCSKVDFKSVLGKSAQETIVGNPMTTRAAKTLLEKVCVTLSKCHPQLSEGNCEVGVAQESGFDYQLGLPKGAYNLFSEIIQAEAANSLFANSSAEAACGSAIESLECTNSAVQQAYDPVTKSFAGVKLMIPTSPGSCPMVFSQPVTRKEYFVAVNGSDTGDGSSSNPWATIDHAARNLVPTTEGAIVHVASGTYTVPVAPACSSNSASCGVNTNISGTATAPIIFISDEQHGAKITAPGASTTWFNSGNYVQIIGFEIIGTASSNFGILSEAAYGKIIGNHIHNIPVTTGCATNYSGGGIFFGYLPSAHDNDAIGNLIHDIGPRLANGLPASSYCPGMAIGISYDQPRGRVQNNIVYNVDSWAIGTWHLAGQLQITNNLLFNNGNVTSTATKVGGAIFISGETNVGVIDDTTVANNIIRNNSGKGLNEFVSIGTKNVYLNNIMYSNGIDFDLRGTVTPQGTITVDPLMVNFAGGDYRLQPTSPAINAGTNVCAVATGNGQCSPSIDYAGFSRALGGVIDIGPYEWHP